MMCGFQSRVSHPVHHRDHQGTKVSLGPRLSSILVNQNIDVQEIFNSKREILTLYRSCHRCILVYYFGGKVRLSGGYSTTTEIALRVLVNLGSSKSMILKNAASKNPQTIPNHGSARHPTKTLTHKLLSNGLLLCNNSPRDCSFCLIPPNSTK